MPQTGPMKTAVFLLRLSPEEKARWERYCSERHISLAHAMREGTRLFLEDARLARQSEADVATT